MAKRTWRTKIVGVIQKISLNKVSLILPLALSFYALYQTCQNLAITERSANESKRSADVAQDALAMQKQQYEDYKKQEELRNIEDSENRELDIKLTNQQIDALKAQSRAIDRGVSNTEVSQKPYLDILNLGFHLEGVKKEFTLSDSAILSYKVTNYGQRPAILKEVTLYQFDKNCNFIKKLPTRLNTLITSTKTFDQTILASGNRLKWGFYEVINLDDFFWCFTFKFKDEFKGAEINTVNSPIIYKWINRRNTSNWFSQQIGLDVFIAFDLCSDKNEEDKILKWFKNKNN